MHRVSCGKLPAQRENGVEYSHRAIEFRLAGEKAAPAVAGGQTGIDRPVVEEDGEGFHSPRLEVF